MRKVAIGCDHAGFAYKKTIIRTLRKENIEVIDKGTYSEESVDYPDFVHPVAEMVENEEVEFGVLICGSGNGVSMAANKHQKVRAALCWKDELAALARQHNDANILSIPARFVSAKMARQMVRTFANTEFEGGRHGRRVDKISHC